MGSKKWKYSLHDYLGSVQTKKKKTLHFTELRIEGMSHPFVKHRVNSLCSLPNVTVY